MLGWVAALAALASGIPGLPDTVIYEENLRAEGPVVGFKAVTARLDSIKALGANVLWLMPVTPVGKLNSAGGLGSPYAFADFTSVNPEFGAPEDLRKLIEEAHRRKMAVIIDWVANHSSWDNPWLKAHNDWYLHDVGGHVVTPPGTNWKDVAQLDYKNHELWSAMIAAMEGWIDGFGIDGFRCDSAEFVPVEFWKSAVSELRAHTKRPLLMLAEGYRPNLLDAGFDLAYGWHFCDRLAEIARGRKASDLAASVAEEAEGVPEGKLRLRFLTNHDKYAWDGTPLEVYKNMGAIKIAFALEAFYGGAPLIYSGQEVNWPSRISIFDHTTIDWSGGSEMRDWIASIIQLRHEHAVLREGTVTDYSTPDTVILDRVLGDEEALIIANVRDWAVSGSVPPTLSGKWKDGQVDRYDIPGYGLKVLFRKKPS